MTILKHHVFAHAVPAWGHNKPLIALAVLIAQARPDVVVTIATNQTIYPKAIKELTNLSEEYRVSIQRRIHIIDVVGHTDELMFFFPQVNTAFEVLFKRSGTIKCMSSGQVVVASDLPRPTLAIIDSFSNFTIQAIRSIASKDEVPILSWFSCTAGGMTYSVGSRTLGGKYDPSLLERINEEVEEGGRSLVEVCQEKIVTANGDLVHIPGYPDLYDYEMFPQHTDIPIGLLWREGQLATYSTEGTINIATSVLEKETIDCLRDHFRSIGKEYINIAPLAIVPEHSNLREQSDDQEVLTFLDTMQAQFGIHSVVYISFGTFFWPEITRISVVIEEFLEEQVPFVLTHPVAELPEELASQISRSGIAKEVTWAPQQQVLAHSATGWFVTHGGWNSMQEAFRYRVPLIYWPIAAEQPLNAALLSLKFDAVFELIEVRRGERGTKKPYRCGDGPSPAFTDESLREELRALLQRLKGDEGRHVRGNFEMISDRLANVWEDGGEAREAFEGFLNKYLT